MFWYEDFLTNKELVARPNVAWRPGGEVMQVTRIDDYTVQYSFAVPYPVVVDKFAFSPYSRNSNTLPLLPRHYMEKFHVDYNAKAAEQAKEAGFDTWWQQFMDVVNSGNMDVVTLKAIAGEFDVATFSLTLDNYPLYKEGEEAGDYRTLIWGLPRNEVAYGFNQSYGDARAGRKVSQNAGRFLTHPDSAEGV